MLISHNHDVIVFRHFKFHEAMFGPNGKLQEKEIQRKSGNLKNKKDLKPITYFICILNSFNLFVDPFLYKD